MTRRRRLRPIRLGRLRAASIGPCMVDDGTPVIQINADVLEGIAGLEDRPVYARLELDQALDLAVSLLTFVEQRRRPEKPGQGLGAKLRASSEDELHELLDRALVHRFQKRRPTERTS